MLPLFHRSKIAAWRLIAVTLLSIAGSALAQTTTTGAIKIQTPNLPPRPGATQTPAMNQQTPVEQQAAAMNQQAPAAQSAYAQQEAVPPAAAYPAQSGYDAQAQPGNYNAPPRPLSAVQPSVLQLQSQQGGYAQQSNNGYAQPGPAYSSTGPAPTRPVTAGPCRVEVAPDRQTLTLVGTTDALPRNFLPLGEFRAQQVVHSPDGRWAVAFLKLRGRAQFAMLTMDLAACKEQHTVDLEQAGEEATFDGDNVTVRAGGKEQQWPVADKRVR